MNNRRLLTYGIIAFVIILILVLFALRVFIQPGEEFIDKIEQPDSGSTVSVPAAPAAPALPGEPATPAAPVSPAPAPKGSAPLLPGETAAPEAPLPVTEP